MEGKKNIEETSLILEDSFHSTFMPDFRCLKAIKTYKQEKAQRSNWVKQKVKKHNPCSVAYSHGHNCGCLTF